ncbi:MAG: hypothetical protein DHS80DRAFT_30287 [Piptocephalis tieghemiana]|nr:MAG: hypothetical protein DHS80DRAFT_30287 [Piptocephalis tieghemiana]
MPKVTREKHSERNNPLSQEDRGTDKLGKKAHASTCTDPKCQGCAPVFEDEEGRVVEPRVADLVAAALNEAKDTTGIQPKAVQLFEQAISLAKDRDGQGIREAPVELADTTFAFARYLSLPSLLDEAAGHYERHTDPGTGLLGQILSQLHALKVRLAKDVDGDVLKEQGGPKAAFTQISKLIHSVLKEPYDFPKTVQGRQRLLKITCAIHEASTAGSHVEKEGEEMEEMNFLALDTVNQIWDKVAKEDYPTGASLALGLFLIEQASLCASSHVKAEYDPLPILVRGIDLVKEGLEKEEGKEEMVEIMEPLGQGYILQSTLETEDDDAALDAYDQGLELLIQVYHLQNGENDKLQHQLVTLGVAEEDLNIMEDEDEESNTSVTREDREKDERTG